MQFKFPNLPIMSYKCKFLWLKWHCSVSVMYSFITGSCSGCFKYPASSGGWIWVVLLCVYLNVAERHLPSHSTKKEWDLKVTLCISPFQKLTFNLYYAARCFALQWKSCLSLLRNKLFPLMRETWILHDALDTDYEIPAPFLQILYGHGQLWGLPWTMIEW